MTRHTTDALNALDLATIPKSPRRNNRANRIPEAQVYALLDIAAAIRDTPAAVVAKHLGSCDRCHMHSSKIGERCTVYIYGDQCEGYIRECRCGGNPVSSFRNDPAPRPTPTESEPS